MEPRKQWNVSSKASARTYVVTDVAVPLGAKRLAFVKREAMLVSGEVFVPVRCSGYQVPVVKSGHLCCFVLLDIFVTIFLSLASRGKVGMLPSLAFTFFVSLS